MDSVMGRESRRKPKPENIIANTVCYRSPHGIAIVVLPGFDSVNVYRFFQEEQHAEALVNGRVWISTLEDCRSHEDPVRGDVGEGTVDYFSETITGNSGDLAFDLVAARSGIVVERSVGTTLSGNSSRRAIQNAWVVCTTERYSPDTMRSFGSRCVRITDPVTFFRSVTESLATERRVLEATMGGVRYSQRSYRHLEPDPGPIGFLKPPDRYASQQEVRMLWESDSAEQISHFELDCPAARRLCSRMS